MKKRKLFILFLICLCLALTGCKDDKDNGGNTKVVLTTGFAEDELFRIGDSTCSLSEAMVYLTNMQNQYESIYGTQIWQRKIGDDTLEKKVKDVVLARMAQIKTMNLLAGQRGVVLTEQEEELVLSAAKEYFSSLNEAEISAMNIDENTVQQLYREYALANKVYSEIIEGTNPEISDDEARTVTVSQIFVKTYALNAVGEKVPYTEESRVAAFDKIKNIQKMLREGVSFDELATRYSEDGQLTVSFRKGEMEPGFESAAFNLGTDEISDIVETQHGYHIIKCISTFNREVTDENKKKIVEERKEEVFGEEYKTFVGSLTKNLNKELWNTISFIHDEEVETSDFFEIYNSYFEDYQMP